MNNENNVDQYYKRTLPVCEELAKWIDEQEDILQRDLTPEEIKVRSLELDIKYCIPPFEASGK